MYAKRGKISEKNTVYVALCYLSWGIGYSNPIYHLRSHTYIYIYMLLRLQIAADYYQDSKDLRMHCGEKNKRMKIILFNKCILFFFVCTINKINQIRIINKT